MNRGVVAIGLALLVLACMACGVVWMGYEVGVAQGLAEGAGGVARSVPGAAPGAVGAHHFFGPGFLIFGFFGFIFKILFIFGLIFLASRLFFRGRWGGRGRGGPWMSWHERQRSQFDEWYREKEAEKNAPTGREQNAIVNIEKDPDDLTGGGTATQL
jgi:hypothetical protein